MASGFDMFVRRSGETGEKPGDHAGSSKDFVIYLFRVCWKTEQASLLGKFNHKRGREGTRGMYQGKEKPL